VKWHTIWKVGFEKRGKRGSAIQVGGASFGSRICESQSIWLRICVD